jgi:hypothetical protein
MIATQNQAREIIASIYGQEFADSVRFVKRSGPSILMRPSFMHEIGLPTLAWRKMEAGADATVWLGAYLGWDHDGVIYFNWEWTPDSDPSVQAYLADLAARAALAKEGK